MGNRRLKSNKFVRCVVHRAKMSVLFAAG